MAGVLSAAMIMAFSVPAMADNAAPQVYVNFICDGVTSGKFVPAGSNVTAPSVPLHAGFTFCGFDKSLYNVTTNTTYVAVYANNALGDEAIRAKKASLPTPAVSATTVADPNAMQVTPLPGPAPAALMNLLQAQQAAANTASASANAAVPAAAAPAVAVPAATQAVANAASALQAAAQNPAAQNALAQAAAAAQTAAQTAAQNPAVQNAAAQAAQTVQAAAQAPAAQSAAQVVTAAANGLPSWAVSLHGVDAAGVAEVYKYWKTVKNVDDATLQANWDALLNHYAGHGTQGW